MPTLMCGSGRRGWCAIDQVSRRWSRPRWRIERRSSRMSRSGSQLASSAKRLPARDTLPIVRALLARSEDATDIHIPLLLWWAMEAKATTDPDAVLALFEDRAIWDLPITRATIAEPADAAVRRGRARSRSDPLRPAFGTGAGARSYEAIDGGV